VGDEEIAVMFGLLVYKPALGLVNYDASASFELCLGQALSNYSDDTSGMNRSGTVLQTTYNRIHPPADGEDVGGNIFRRERRLGLR